MERQSRSTSHTFVMAVLRRPSFLASVLLIGLVRVLASVGRALLLLFSCSSSRLYIHMSVIPMNYN
jgi:hypothetical protein